ncbi:MAG: carboxypeptidase-like regulatory domain-containing protein [Patescibacteria group bacterium]
MFKKLFKINFFVGLLIFCFLLQAFAVSPDAIGLRIVPNLNHWSAQRWYKEQGFTGSPQSLVVDGYGAVRDGRTVYVNVANIDDKGTATTTDDDFWTNINIISYNQSAESATLDIFGQILTRWKFNTNITDEEVKQEIIKDTARLASLADIKTALENYKSKNGFFPKLSSGSYLSNKTISTWPSWQGALGKELGITLPIDPVNKLGACSGFNEITCWNEQEKKFSTRLPTLPDNSRVFFYNGLIDGSEYSLCAVMGSGYIDPADVSACKGSLSTPTTSPAFVGNRPPVINCDNLIGANGKEFIGYINGYDPDGDYHSWSLFPQNIPWTNWASSTAPLSWGPAPVRNYQRIYSAKAGDKDDYNVKVVVSDTSTSTEKICKITVGGFCGDGVWNNVMEGCDINDNVATTSAVSSSTKQYGCTDECAPTGGYCGDTILQDTKGEKCDDHTNVATTPAESSVTKQYGCTVVCGWTGGWCGDTILHDAKGEMCDETEGLVGWRCLGAGALQCQSCQRSCTDNGTLAQCGTGTSTLSGVISDSLLNNQISGALIEVKDSKNKLIATTTTNSQGEYSFLNLQKSFPNVPILCGYKMIVSKKTGYQNGEVVLFAFDRVLTKDLSLVPAGLTTGTKIKLTWNSGATPIDLDAHLKFEAIGETIDICYGDMGPYIGASLDADNKDVVNSTSTETITIDPFVKDSTYRYYIHNYSGTSFSSLPVVEIIGANSNVLYTFSPTSSASFLEYWYLFDIDGSTGNLTLKSGLNGVVQNEEPD